MTRVAEDGMGSVCRRTRRRAWVMWVWVMVLAVQLGARPTVASTPIQTFIFAGQSNISWDIRAVDFYAYQNGALKDWLDSSENDGLYTYERHLVAGVTESPGWIPLGALLNPGQTHWTQERIGQEHIFAWRVTEYLRSHGIDDRVGIIKVQKSATQMRIEWNPGGRDSKPTATGSPPYAEGSLHSALIDRVTAALADLTDPYTVDGLVWWQGEGDVATPLGGENYHLWLDDLINGWTPRTEWWDLDEDGTPDYPGVPEDDVAAYSLGLRALTGFDFPAVLTRISWNIEGNATWGPRAVWEPHLINVRDALDGFAEDDPHGSVSIDIDDIALLDAFHYGSTDYIETGERYAWEYLRKSYGHHAGDVNLDGIVDVADLALVGSQWQTSGIWPQHADGNGDGVVDVADLGLVGSGWTMPAGPSSAGAASVPLPGGLSVVSAGILLASLRGGGGREVRGARQAPRR